MNKRFTNKTVGTTTVFPWCLSCHGFLGRNLGAFTSKYKDHTVVDFSQRQVVSPLSIYNTGNNAGETLFDEMKPWSFIN